MAHRQHVAAGSRRALARIAVLVTLLAATPSASVAAVGGPGVRGVVTESQSGQPVAGAQVLVLWLGTLPMSMHSSSGGCYQVLHAVTDVSGRFAVPPWRKDLPGVSVDDYRIHIYARGYGDANGDLAGADVRGRSRPAAAPANDGNRIELPRFAGSVRDRLEQLARLRVASRCVEAGASRRNAVDFYRSMNDELLELAATQEGQEIAAGEKPEIDFAQRQGLPLLTPRLVVDLAPFIAALQSAHDGELYEPARPPGVPTAPTVPGKR